MDESESVGKNGGELWVCVLDGELAKRGRVVDAEEVQAEGLQPGTGPHEDSHGSEDQSEIDLYCISIVRRD